MPQASAASFMENHASRDDMQRGLVGVGWSLRVSTCGVTLASRNVGSTQARPTRADRPEVDPRRLVSDFLRMAPDVAIVGEVRDRAGSRRRGNRRCRHPVSSMSWWRREPLEPPTAVRLERGAINSPVSDGLARSAPGTGGWFALGQLLTAPEGQAERRPRCILGHFRRWPLVAAHVVLR